MSNRIVILSIDDQEKSYTTWDNRYTLDCRLDTISKFEYPYISLDHDVTAEEVDHAIDVILTKFIQDSIHNMEIDLNDRNESKTPVKEMTINEIESELGYKIKIVN